MKKRVSILRYPGGKFKAIKYIKPFWEKIEHKEYREPFVGGGSVFIAKPKSKFNWINDINEDLFSFYKVLSDQKLTEILIRKLLKFKVTKKNYEKVFHSNPKEIIDKAKKFYILNRCSFSGISKWKSFIGDVRYNIKKKQDNLRLVGNKIRDFKITNIDFEKVINSPPKTTGKVFLFLDPPYAESRQEAAYEFPFTRKDHLRLAKMLKKTKYSFLLTYDDCQFVRSLYSWANIYERGWTYSVANVRTHHNPREYGKELFISNFKLDNKEDKTLNLFQKSTKN